MYHLKNDLLSLSVQPTGAELCNISSVRHQTQFMWNAAPDIWGSFAPNLFPIIGGLKDNSYIHEGKRYSLPKHGIVRHNDALTLYKQSDTTLGFVLSSNAALLQQYPFLFEFYIDFKLNANTITVRHRIVNKDSKPLYFSVGGHPAFKCPVFDGERYEDYTLEFEHEEQAVTHLLNPKTGLVTAQTRTVLNASRTLPLSHDLFHADALIFKDLKSRKVTLNSKHNGSIVSVHYPDFNYLGIWAKPNGDFVCIEPWLGIADPEDSTQILKDKEAILCLEAQQSYTATYTIEIHKTHL
jgi:galactose mutarotase-like enzyme